MNRVEAPFALVLVCVGCQVSNGAPQSTGLAIQGGTILVGPDLVPVQDGTILVEDGRIVCAGAAAQCPMTGSWEVIDATGTHVIPGLFDAHVHVAEYASLPHAPLYLAHGITSVRDMGGRADSAQALRRRWQRAPLGPNLFMAGNPIDGSPVRWPASFPDVPVSVATPQEARRAVRAAAESGADFIKLYYGLDPASLEAAVREAHAHGLKATADLTGWPSPTAEALAAGIDGLEHFLPELGPGTGMPDWPRGSWARNAEEMDDLAQMMASQNVALTVTTGLFREMFYDSFPDQKPTFAALPREMQSRSRLWWDESQAGRLGVLPPAIRQAVWTNFSQATCRFVRSLLQAGGRLMLGTDAFWQTMYPGDIHGELEWLVDCGVDPRDALASATSVPARWLGADSLGSISVGAVADLVVLDGDPLADIRNTRRIRLVMRRGAIRMPADLLAEAHVALRTTR